jgi:hypothetical protein
MNVCLVLNGHRETDVLNLQTSVRSIFVCGVSMKREVYKKEVDKRDGCSLAFWILLLA